MYRLDTSHVIQSDQVLARIMKDTDNAGAAIILKVCTQETLEATAWNLARLHRRANVDFKSMFGIRDRTKPTNQPENTTPVSRSIVCDACSSTVSKKVVR